MAAGFLQEPALLGLAYATEQLLGARRPPQMAGTPPPQPPDAGIRDAPPGARDVRDAVAALRAERLGRTSL
jgi:hypothetical protein